MLRYFSNNNNNKNNNNNNIPLLCYLKYVSFIFLQFVVWWHTTSQSRTFATELNVVLKRKAVGLEISEIGKTLYALPATFHHASIVYTISQLRGNW
jgi:hypothetical protein